MGGAFKTGGYGMPSIFAFGDCVEITDKYVRRYEKRAGKMHSESWKVWRVQPFFRKTCIFLGERTLRDGIVHYDYEDGHTFISKEHFQAALVSPGPKEKPVYVPFGAIKHCKLT